MRPWAGHASTTYPNRARRSAARASRQGHCSASAGDKRKGASPRKQGTPASRVRSHGSAPRWPRGPGVRILPPVTRGRGVGGGVGLSDRRVPGVARDCAAGGSRLTDGRFLESQELRLAGSAATVSTCSLCGLSTLVDPVLYLPARHLLKNEPPGSTAQFPMLEPTGKSGRSNTSVAPKPHRLRATDTSGRL